jgi:drug/metabolite transporter (DMT)-like permease
MSVCVRCGKHTQYTILTEWLRRGRNSSSRHSQDGLRCSYSSGCLGSSPKSVSLFPPVPSSWTPPLFFLTFSGLIGIAYDGSATRDSRAWHDGHLRPGFILQTRGYIHFTYLRAHQIIFATILERMIFHEIPTPLSLCGILIIMSSAIYVAVSRVFVYLSIMLDELHGRPFFKFSFYILVGFLTAAVHS